MKLSNNKNAKKQRYNHVLNHLKNIKAEILNTTTECNNNTFEVEVVSELKSLKMTIKLFYVSFLFCVNRRDTDGQKIVNENQKLAQLQLAAGRLACL